MKIENGWTVEEVEPNGSTESKVKGQTRSIDEIFEKHDDQVRARLTKKLAKLKERVDKLKAAPAKGKKAKKKKDALKNLKSLELKKTNQRVEIDEPLTYEGQEEQQKIPPQVEEIKETPPVVDTVDPNKVTTLVYTQRKTTSSAGGIGDALMDDDAADYDEEDERGGGRTPIDC